MTAKHRALRLRGVPLWATPDDVKRMAERARADGIVDGMHQVVYILFLWNQPINSLVKIHSFEGLPTGEASIEYLTPNMTKRAAILLENVQMSAVPVYVASYEHARHKTLPKGKVTPYSPPEAAEAPATTVIYGLPKYFSVADVRTFLDDYRLSTFGTAREAYVNLMR